MKNILILLGAVVLFVCGLTAALASSSRTSAIQSTTTVNNAHNKITICHATGSKTNPYVVNTPDASGVIDGHYPHQDKRDIIPPFFYFKGKVKLLFPGQNWTAQGQAIFNNGCKIPKPGTSTGATTSTTPGTTVTLPGTTVFVTTPTKTVTVTTPGSTTTVTSPGSTTTVKTPTKVRKVTKKQVRVTSHRRPKSTG